MPRQKEHGISRLNIAANLRQNLKFIRFCNELQVKEQPDGIGYLVSFWIFAANNCAMSGSIESIEPWIIAKEAGWTGNEKTPDQFIAALKKSGLVDENDQIHDWFEHQPLASEVLRNRARRQSQDITKESTVISEIRPEYDQVISADKVKVSKGNVTKEKKHRSPNGDVAGATLSRVDNYVDNVDNSTQSQKKQELKQKATTFAIQFNQLTKKFPAIPPVKVPLINKYMKKLIIRLQEPNFNPDTILKAIPHSKWATGTDSGRGVNFDWIIRNEENYLKLIEWAKRDLRIKKAKQADEQQPTPQPTYCPQCNHRLDSPFSTFINPFCPNCAWTEPNTYPNNPQPLKQILTQLNFPPIPPNT